MTAHADPETAPVNVRVVKLWVAVTFPLIAAAASIATGWAVRASEIAGLREAITRVEGKVDQVDTRVERVADRVGGLAERLARLEGRLDLPPTEPKVPR